MNEPEHFFLPDTQSVIDPRQLAIQRVGVKGLRYPLTLINSQGQEMPTVAVLSTYVGLLIEQPGKHREAP